MTLEEKLIADKSFQHILKFAPSSQRELMTFELARYFDAIIEEETAKARAEEPESLTVSDLLNASNVDILIPVKHEERNDELRHVLRAIEKHVPHRNIVIVGYRPSWLTNVQFIPHDLKDNKFTTVIHHIVHATHDKDLSEEFMLFHDDNYVLCPIESMPIWHKGLLTDRIKELDGRVSPSRQHQVENMKRTVNLCTKLGIEAPLDYSLHVPRMLSKRSVQLAWGYYHETYPDGQPLLFNTLIHNIDKAGGHQMVDVKIYDAETEPGQLDVFISTTDSSFNYGKVGARIRELFPDKSRYEL